MSASQPADFGTHVREVQAQLAESAQRAGLVRDPYARVLEAQSAALGILPVFIQEIDRSRQPWTTDERRDAVKDAVRQMDQRMALRMVQFNKAGIAIIAAIILAVGGVAFGAGWWWHGEQGLMAGLSVGQQQCFEQNGGILCQIPIWKRLPPTHGGN